MHWGRAFKGKLIKIETDPWNSIRLSSDFNRFLLHLNVRMNVKSWSKSIGELASVNKCQVKTILFA